MLLFHDRRQRIRHLRLVLGHEGKPLTQEQPEAMGDERVMEKRPQRGVLRSGLVSADRAQHRRVGVRLMLEEVAEQRDHAL